MENNNQDQSEKEEIPNMEQFQVERSPSEEKNLENDEDADYTEEEVEFADGEGTQLNEEIDDDEIIDDEEVDEEIENPDDESS